MATNPTVTIKVDSTQAQSSIGAINSAVKNLGADFAKLDTQAKFDKLRKSLTEARKTVEALESANVTATKEYQQSLKAVNDLEAAYAELARTNTDLNATFEDVAGEVQPLSSRLGEMEDRLYELALAGQQNTQEFKDLTAEAGRYRQAMIQTDLAVDSAALTMTQKLGGALQGVVGAFAVAQGAMGLFGVESEATEKALLKVQSAMAILQGFQAIKESLPALKGLKDSISGLVAPLLAQAGATGTVTVAQRIMNAVMNANPIFLIITGITALVGAYALFSSEAETAEEKQKKLNEAQEAANTVMENHNRKIDERIALEKELNSVITGGRVDQENQIRLLEAQGASLEQIFEARKNLTLERLDELQNAEFNSGRVFNAKEKAANIKEIKATQTELQVLSYEFSNAQTAIADKAAQDAADKAKKRKDDALRSEKEYNDKLLAYFDALEADRQGRITDSREKELQEAANRYDSLTNLADKAGQDTKEITDQYQKDIEAINKKYNDLDKKKELDKLNTQKKLNSELLVLQNELLMQQEINALSSEEYTDEKIQEIRKKYAEKILNAQINQIETERDVLLTNTELTEEERQEIIADSELKIAKLRGEFRDENLKDEAKSVEEQKELNKSLLESYKGVSDALINAVSASFSGSFDAINDAFATLNESLFGEEGLFERIKQGSITAMEAIAVGIQTVSGILSSVFDNQEEKALEASGERFEASSEKYDELLANRLISQQQYDAKVKQLEDKKAEEEKQARLKAFKQNKALAIVNAVIGGAQAIISGFSTPPFLPLGLIMGGLAAGLVAAQIGIISSQQFKAARGGIVPGSGPSTVDSVDAKLAPGETVINAQSSSMFPGLLSELNQIGGGVSLAPDPIENMTAGGGTVFEPQGGALRAYVVEQDMTDSQRRVRRMENAGTFG